jgi:glucokinase
MILAGDVGGTKVELALFEDVTLRKIVKQERFLCKEYGSLEEIIQKFLSSKCFIIDAACFGIAGPIENNRCQATNLPWIIEAEKLKDLIGVKSVFLINDLEANAWGIPLLSEDELFTLSPGKELATGNRALISAGTGLGEAGIYSDGKTYQPFATEGGHCNFAPNTEEEVEIWRYFKTKFGHVSYERLLCGAGLINLYHFFVDVKKEQELPEVRELFLHRDPAQVIHEYGASGKCPICVKAVERFISIYGSEAGNLALKFLALGGVYVGGGIAPKMLEIIKKGGFLAAFCQKGRFSRLLSNIRIQVILNPKTALLGAAVYAENSLSKKSIYGLPG